MSEYFDLSHPIQNGMSYFPGDPRPEVAPAAGALDPWRVSALQIGTHTGTHIDAASHYIAGGETIDRYPLGRFILHGTCISVPGLAPDEPVESYHLEPYLIDIPKGGAVAIHTGWDRSWGEELYLEHPYLSPKAVRLLVGAGVSLVGIDALNVDSTRQGTTHAHQGFLGNNILIVENLRGLEQLQPLALYHFAFLPLSLPGLDGSPVRAVAWTA